MSRSASSTFFFSFATWCCLLIFTPQLSFRSTPISLHIMHVHKHADTHTRAALLPCRLYPLVGCATPCPSLWKRYVSAHLTAVLLHTSLLSLPSSCDTAFLSLPCSTWVYFIESLTENFFHRIPFPSEVDPCVTFPVCQSSSVHFSLPSLASFLYFPCPCGTFCSSSPKTCIWGNLNILNWV